MQSVSVIIPTYNRAKYLQRAMLSVCLQKNFKGEIIIVDDGSTDSTKEVVEGMKCSFPIIYRYIENCGPAGARNFGVELSSYQFLAFLDSDDHWKKNKLTKQLSLMEQNPIYNICHTGEKWLRKGEHLNQKNIHIPRHGDIFDHCLRLCAVGMSTVLMKRWLFEEVGGFDVSLPCCEDYDLWLRISCKYPFLLVPDPLTIKEGGRADQVSSKHRIGMDKYRIYAILKLLDEKVLNHEQHSKAIIMLNKKCQVYGKGCIKHGRIDEGEYYLGVADKYKIRQ